MLSYSKPTCDWFYVDLWRLVLLRSPACTHSSYISTMLYFLQSVSKSLNPLIRIYTHSINRTHRCYPIDHFYSLEIYLFDNAFCSFYNHIQALLIILSFRTFSLFWFYSIFSKYKHLIKSTWSEKSIWQKSRLSLSTKPETKNYCLETVRQGALKLIK